MPVTFKERVSVLYRAFDDLPPVTHPTQLASVLRQLFPKRSATASVILNCARTPLSVRVRALKLLYLLCRYDTSKRLEPNFDAEQCAITLSTQGISIYVAVLALTKPHVLTHLRALLKTYFSLPTESDIPHPIYFVVDLYASTYHRYQGASFRDFLFDACRALTDEHIETLKRYLDD